MRPGKEVPGWDCNDSDPGSRAFTTILWCLVVKAERNISIQKKNLYFLPQALMGILNAYF